MATIGLVPLILMLIMHTTSISVAQIPTHPSTTLVGTASLCAVLLITRSGSASLSPGNLRAVGGHLNYWLKTPYLDLANAYRLHLNLEDLYVNHDYPRFYGFSLRCLSSLPRPSGRGRRGC